MNIIVEMWHDRQHTPQYNRYNWLFFNALKKIVRRVFLDTHYLFFQPAFLPTLEDNEAVLGLDHQFVGFPF